MCKGGGLASPNLFAYTLPNSYLGEAAIYFGLTGPSFIINHAQKSNLWCLRISLSGMADGQFNTVISGVGDLNAPSQFEESCFKVCGALFFVIEKSIRKNREAYGRLKLHPGGLMTFDGDEIENIEMLARMCVAARVRQKKPINIHRARRYPVVESCSKGPSLTPHLEQHRNQPAP